MHQIETPRLLLQPLTLAQLSLYLANDGSLERALGLRVSAKTQHPAEVADALETFFLPQVAQHPSHFFFYTLWAIVLKDEQTLVGDLCFKGPPEEEGQVEIGYGTYAPFQRKGYMTEALAGLVAWCTQRPDITTLLAETEPSNGPSEKVLLRNHFLLDCQTPDSCWWKLKVK